MKHRAWNVKYNMFQDSRFKIQSQRGFTLIELLIVIGIVAILATVTLLVLNPAEMLKQGRDSKRLSELNTINEGLNFAASQKPNLVLGTSNAVYISLPDTASDCSSFTSLPDLPPGWSYRCATETDYRKVDGNGWIPVDFTGLASTVFSSLPVDPVNSEVGSLYYSYVAGTSWELNAVVESEKYGSGGSRDVAGGDGGTNAGVFERGTNLSLAPLLCGDINQDRLITMDDFDVLNNFIYFSGTVSDGAVTDLDNSSSTDALDLQLLFYYLSGGLTPTCGY